MDGELPGEYQSKGHAYLTKTLKNGEMRLYTLH